MNVIIVIIIVLVILSLFGSNKKSSLKEVDSLKTYHPARKKAEKAKYKLEDYIWKNGEKPEHFDNIMMLYNNWLTLSEKAVKFKCIENDGSGQYTPIDTLFYILVYRKQKELVPYYIDRLNRLKFDDAEEVWKQQKKYRQKQIQAEKEHNEWCATVPGHVIKLQNDGRTSELLKLGLICIDRYEHELASGVFNALILTKGKVVSDDKILVLEAGIARVKEQYDQAIKLLQKAYPIAYESGVKSRINKVEVEMRKIFNEKGVSDPHVVAGKYLNNVLK